MLSKIVWITFLFIFLWGQCLHAQTVVNITSKDAKPLLENTTGENLVIIDSLDSRMFAEEYIKDAININAFDEKAPLLLAQHLHKDSLLVYCTNCNRTNRINKLLKASGYQGTIINMTDGITGWKNNHYEIYQPAEDVASTQPEKKDEKTDQLKPIVQVFGTAAYDIEQERYGYSFGRAHLGFQYQFNEAWSAKMIIDRGRPTTIDGIEVTDSAGNTLNVDYTTKEGSYYTMWLKFASLKWQVNNKLSVVGGALLQNHYITQERFWGLRYVAQTFQDMYWHIPSTDLGFRVNYKLNDVFNLDAALTNGEGPRVKQDALGKIKYAAGLDISPDNKFQSRIYYHNKTTGIDSLSTEQMFSVFAGCKFSEQFRVGGEFNYMNHLNNDSGTDSYGFSVFSAYHITESMQLFVRYDRLLYESENLLPTNLANGNTIIGGLSYAPVKGINLSMNYQSWIPDAENNSQQNNILLSMEYTF